MTRHTRFAAAATVGAASLALCVAGTPQAAAAAAPTATAASCYVVVFQLADFKGHSACITGDYANLAGFSWPGTNVSMDNSISSIQLDKACVVDLYQYKSYSGAHSHWTRKEPWPGAITKDTTLSNNKVGDNRTSSIKINCYIDA